MPVPSRTVQRAEQLTSTSHLPGARPKPADLVQGTLTLLILREIALEPMYGWAIAPRLSLMSQEQCRVGQSALYTALHKLE